MKTGFISSETFQNHDTGPGHPEQIARVSVIIENFKKLKNKNSRLRADDLLEEENFFEDDLFDNLFNNPSAENDTCNKFILRNCVGKIYHNYRYYNNTVNEKRILIVCRN